MAKTKKFVEHGDPTYTVWLPYGVRPRIKKSKEIRKVKRSPITLVVTLSQREAKPIRHVGGYGGLSYWYWDLADDIIGHDPKDDEEKEEDEEQPLKNEDEETARKGDVNPYAEQDEPEFPEPSEPKSKLHDHGIKRRSLPHLLGQVSGGWDRKRELELFDGDPRFAHHAPRVYQLCLARWDSDDADELNDIVMTALTWLSEDNRPMIGEHIPHYVVGANRKRPDPVCQRVEWWLDEHLAKEQPFKRERHRTEDGREWSDYGQVYPESPQTATNWDNFDDEQSSGVTVWDMQEVKRWQADTGYDNKWIIHKDHVSPAPYPKSEALADLFKLVMSNARFDDVLNRTTVYKDLDRILAQVQLKMDKAPTLELDGYTQKQIARELGISQATVSRRLTTFKELWESKAAEYGWTWRPTSEDLAKQRTGASGGWGSRAFADCYPKPDLSVLGGLICHGCRAAAEAGEVCPHDG